MVLSLTHNSLEKYFWPTIMDLSDRFRHSISRKGLTVLSVSLVNGRFRAMSIVNDTIDQSWERPGVILKLALLQQAISDAIHYTQFPGTRISILVEDRRCLSLTLQLPIIPITDLVPILERKAQQAKSWEGPAAWRYSLGIQGKGQQSVYLEMFPQNFIDEIAQICENLDLELQQLAPLSALSESQLSTLSIEPGRSHHPDQHAGGQGDLHRSRRGWTPPADSAPCSRARLGSAGRKGWNRSQSHDHVHYSTGQCGYSRIFGF